MRQSTLKTCFLPAASIVARDGVLHKPTIVRLGIFIERNFFADRSTDDKVSTHKPQEPHFTTHYQPLSTEVIISQSFSQRVLTWVGPAGCCRGLLPRGGGEKRKKRHCIHYRFRVTSDPGFKVQPGSPFTLEKARNMEATPESEERLHKNLRFLTSLLYGDLLPCSSN